MTTSALALRTVPDAPPRPRRYAAPAGLLSEPALDPIAELAREVLHSLPRSDQRRSGELYLRGLLAAEGRKTLRNIAAPTGRPADAQRLHHFVSDSTWDWGPVRQALATLVDDAVRPVAWVVRATRTSRHGPGGVGVGPVVDPGTGRTVNGRRSVGLWLVTRDAGFPVNWRLILSSAWRDDPRRRDRFGIPATAAGGGSTSCGIDMVLEMAGRWGVRRAPVIIDARRAHVTGVVDTLSALDMPYLLRIRGSQHVGPGALPQRRSGSATLVTARQLATADQGSAVGHARNGAFGARREVVRHPCHTPATRHARRPHVLLVERDPLRPQCASYWLTNLTGHGTAALLWLARTPGRVSRYEAGPGGGIGLHDFEGRSFAGWHRHITLASVAHTAMTLLPAHHPHRTSGVMAP
ncbi:IS701 family transposase [Streptomyces acidicola]|uniref:Transposase n=1 Tax=Streptomyces acidicola TaxID=2596892 RepID=A0A5N8WRQ2_9ACTN|nr:transposase [Streptomyces acidicola]MPY49949.1 transposase [Streptomyces acidicola]